MNCVLRSPFPPLASAGFRVDPVEKLTKVHQELSALHEVHASDPILGVDFEEESTVSVG